MIFGSRKTRRVSRSARDACLRNLCVGGIALLVGCGGSTEPSSRPLADADQPTSTDAARSSHVRWASNNLATQPKTELRVASMMATFDLYNDASSDQPISAPDLPSPSSQPPKYWAFTSDHDDGPTLHLPALVRLPPVDHPAEPAGDGHDLPPGHLLPPQPIDHWAANTRIDPVLPTPLDLFAEIDTSAVVDSTTTDKPPRVTDLSLEERQLLEAVIRDASAVSTGVVTNARLDELAKSKIRRGYALAGRRAYYAARKELIEVLRMISRAKDARHGAPERTVALAAGLRALDEAADFLPRGTQLEAELNVNVIAAAHRTLIFQHLDGASVLPQQMLDMYFRYAQLKLSLAVASEPSGSMALHALGKINRQLGQDEPERHPLAGRRAMAFQQAALLAHNQNHLAAHELAVLMADSGHFAEAERLLLQVAAREPNAIVYRNLARVQQRLGVIQQVASHRDYARRLLQQGASRNPQVQWLSPQAFAATGGRQPRYATAMATPPRVQSTIPGRRAPSPTNFRR